MALGTITVTATARAGGMPSAPLFAEPLAFEGDDSYPNPGGTASFKSLVEAAIGKNIEIVAVVPENCGAYLPQYDRTNDKLKVLQISDGAEVANEADLHATTFNVVVFYQ